MQGWFLGWVHDATAPDRGDSAAMTAHPLSVRVVAADGVYSVLDVHAGAGVRLPPLVHRREDATVHVLDGAVTFRLDGAEHLLEAGDRLGLPRGVPVALDVRADAHLVVVVAPAGIEWLADVLSEPLPDQDDVAALLAAAGVSLLPGGLVHAA